MTQSATLGGAGAQAPARNAIRVWIGERPATQIVVFVSVIALFAWLGATMDANIERTGIRPGFDFLHSAANFDIGESLIAYSPADSFGRAILVGLLNTLVVSAAGCVLATILGVALGIGRLSENPLLSGSVRAYVELMRNTPLLLQLFVWNGLFHALPAARQAFSPLPGMLLSNRGVFIPALTFTTPEIAWAFALLAAILVSAPIVAARTSPARRRRRRLLAGAAIGALVVAIAWPLAQPGLVGVDIPALKGFNIRGGLSLTPEFSALLVGLVVNAAAGIAEIVRSGIEAIPAGQWEAARSLGLSRAKVLQLVVLPQAVRIILPVMTSSYLSLTKNSSLAVAIGYPDLVSIVNTVANQTGQAVEAILIMVSVYLMISLSVSFAMNRYNAHLLARSGR